MKKVVDSQVYKIIQKTTNGKDLVSKNAKKKKRKSVHQGLWSLSLGMKNV